MLLNDGFNAEGLVAFDRAHVGSSFICTGEITSTSSLALFAANMQVDGSARLAPGFKATGGVSLDGARIGGDLDCRHGNFLNCSGDALSTREAQIQGGLLISDGFKTDGAVGLSNTRVDVLFDDSASWPAAIDLEGFVYRQLVTPDRGWGVRRLWLRRQTAPSPFAYLQLAAVYRGSGDDRDARKILIERHNVLLDPPPDWKAQPGIAKKWSPAWIVRQALRVTIGHGYEPWRALCVALPLLLAMSFACAQAKSRDLFVPIRSASARSSVCTSHYECFQPVIYAVDTVLPLVG